MPPLDHHAVYLMVGGHLETDDRNAPVIRFGRCSAVLVQPDALLTSAHCIGVPPAMVTIGGESIVVTQCTAHADYRPLRREHDLAICRLGSPSGVTPLAIDTASLHAGDEVELTGFGATAPLARDGGTIRSVTARVTLSNTGINAGDAAATACWGDSGGAATVSHGGERRVAGIIHGPSSAVCASATELVTLASERAWLAAMGVGRQPSPPGYGVLTAIVLVAGAAVTARRSLRTRT